MGPGNWPMRCALTLTQLTQHVVPSVSADEAELVRSLLSDAGASVTYITSPCAARAAVTEICAGTPDVIGLDFETEVLPAYRQPIPIKFTKNGNLTARQPRDGAAGAALDPYRSKVRLVQAWAGGAACYVFDMRSVAWADIAPLFELPLAIFNAVFEVKRLIHEAKIEPTGRIYDVMTAVWLTDGRRPSLAEAVTINYGLNIPKDLGASDWSADILSPEQLEYAALDAVLCRLLWNTQQNELFDDIDRQCQQVADAVIPAIARMELHGMPVDVGAHRAQIARWNTELAAAQKALHHASPLRDLRKPAELQAHLCEVLDVETLAAWPRTDSGRLVDPPSATAAQQSSSRARRAAAGSCVAEADRRIRRQSDRRHQPCDWTTTHQLPHRRRLHRPLRRPRTKPAANAKASRGRLPPNICRTRGTAGDGAGL